MKKIYSIMLVCLTIASAQAQFEKGTILISGKSGFDFSSLTEKAKASGNTATVSKSTSISFTPMGGYFVIDNLAVGANINFALDNIKQDFNDEQEKQTSIAFGPFARYYFGPGVFGEASFAFGSSTSTITQGSTSTKQKSGIFGLGLAIGYAVMITDDIAIEPSIGYASTTFTPDGTSGLKYVTSGIVLGAGISVYISK